MRPEWREMRAQRAYEAGVVHPKCVEIAVFRAIIATALTLVNVGG
jgi:hypothetical protein